ncbi:hypothetical protein OG21DRAFT_1497669 [Imleria badia]|nr:hypothetical protein OG21DRAFT_1497669 [Imleria badia]
MHGVSHYFSKVVHHGHLEASIVYHSSALDVWPCELINKPDRFIDKIEACSAHTMTPGHDGCPPVVDKEHHHTFLRVTLAPSEGHPGETIFIERVLTEQDKATHSVIPVAPDADAATPNDATPYEGDTFHDHACIILQGSPSTLIHDHHIKIDREIEFASCPDRQLSLYELATFLRFLSTRGLRAVSIGLDTACETYSKWFCRATMCALGEGLIMRCASRHFYPPKGPEAAQIEIAMQRSVDAWLRSTFEEYPLEEVAAENLARQMNVMNEEEKGKMLAHIAKREDELRFKAIVQEAFRQRGFDAPGTKSWM